MRDHGKIQLAFSRKLGEAVKAGCRLLCGPVLPILPASILNRLPFLGRVSIEGPNGLRLLLHTHGRGGKDRIAVKLAKRGFWSYEGETTRIFLPLVNQKDAAVVIDIGANTGLFALLAARANPRCRVVAFEPVPLIFELLQANVRLNGLTNLEAIDAAVSDAVGATSFFVSHTHVGIPMDTSSRAGFRDNVEEIRLPTITLDSFMAKSALPRLDVLKIDAETAEAQVIRGGLETLRRHRPFVICEVLDGVNHEFVEQTFASLAYHFLHIGPERLERQTSLTGSRAVDQRNYLFVPAEKAGLVKTLCREAGIPLDDGAAAAA